MDNTFKSGLKRGFTLVELITVVIIIAILASLTVPNYIRTIERAKDKEAIVNLKLIKAAQKIYKLEYGDYYGVTGQNQAIAELNSALGLDLNENTWDYLTYDAGNLSQARANREVSPQNPPQGYARSWGIYFDDAIYNGEPTCFCGGQPWQGPACPPGP